MLFTDLSKALIIESNNGNKIFIVAVIITIFYTILIGLILSLNQSFYFCYKRQYEHNDISRNKIENILIKDTLKFSTGFLWYYLFYLLWMELDIKYIIYFNIGMIECVILSSFFTYVYHYFLINKSIKDNGFIQTIYAKLNDIDITSIMINNDNNNNTFLFIYFLKMIELIISSLGISASFGLILIANNNFIIMNILCIIILILNVLLLIICSYIMINLNNKRRKIFKRFRRYSVMLGL